MCAIRHRAPLAAALALACWGPAAAGAPPDAGIRVVGGGPADPAAWGFAASLQSPGGGHFCGGSVVGPRAVLTAAHCVVDGARVMGPGDLEVVAGTAAPESGAGERHAVAAVHVHPAYDALRGTADAALIVLDAPTAAPAVPLQTGPASSGPPDWAMVEAAGWGIEAEDGDAVPATLRSVALPVQPSRRCARLLGEAVGPGQLCAGYDEGGRDTCQGDSGGPLVLRTAAGAVLVGVTSSGQGCARPRSPGVYTRVSALAPWLGPELAGALAPSAAFLAAGPRRVAGTAPVGPDARPLGGHVHAGRPARLRVRVRADDEAEVRLDVLSPSGRVLTRTVTQVDGARTYRTEGVRWRVPGALAGARLIVCATLLTADDASPLRCTSLRVVP